MEKEDKQLFLEFEFLCALVYQPSLNFKGTLWCTLPSETRHCQMEFTSGIKTRGLFKLQLVRNDLWKIKEKLSQEFDFLCEYWFVMSHGY